MADRIRERLVGCFEKVFPALPKDVIPAATHDNVAGWDSLTQVTLVALIGEEFELEVDFEEFESATSFPRLLKVVREKFPHGQ